MNPATLRAVSIRNFKCFRQEVTVELGPSTYLIGPNNAGKTALLEAVRCFFDSTAYAPELINRTEFAAKKEGFNRSDIRMTIGTNGITGQRRGKRIRDEWGDEIQITKSFTWREASGTLSIEYEIAGDRYRPDELPDDIGGVLNAVSLSYVHPQEGAALLARAQDKFKQRLFHNWGRHASVAERVNALQDKWEDLRAVANTYLSAALSTRLKDIWPNAEVRVDLPEKIQDLVAVSDITFRSSPNLPQISLTSQGTGAQSAILYQTHYVLDSDRSLHTGMYFPVWLLEEPESFLHADIALQLGRFLNSPEWLESIQMIVSTHSPLILAGSRQHTAETRWILVDAHDVQWQKGVGEITDDDLEEVGGIMGDANFPVYFSVSTPEARLIIEDSRAVTADKLRDAGIPVTDQVEGVVQLKKYIDVVMALESAMPNETFFLADADEGSRELSRYIQSGVVLRNVEGWRKIRLGDRTYLILLPEGKAVEDLFDEWSDVLESAYSDLLDDQGRLRQQVPLDLTRAVAALRRTLPEGRDEVLAILRRQQDVKDRFWSRIDQWAIAAHHSEAVLALLTE